MQKNIARTEKIKLFNFARRASNLANRLPLDTNHLTPTNYESEKAKFLNNNSYNPQYKYRKVKIGEAEEYFSQLHISLNLLDIPSDLRNYLKKYLNDLYHVYKTKKSIGSLEFSTNARKIFNWDFDNIENIEKVLPKTNPKSSDETPLDAQEIKKAFEQTLYKKYSIFDYPIMISKFNSHIISDGLTKLTIGAEVKRNPNNVKRLIVHEMESHVLQKRNVRMSRNPLLKLTTYKDRMVYMEGIAVYNEFKTNTITKSAYDIYKARLEAVKISHKSFSKIYKQLKKNVSEDKAFITAYRVKRGMPDTSRAGGLPKDAAYLEGYVLIKELETSGEDIEKLYLYRIPRLGKLLLKYNLLVEKDYLLPKFNLHSA